ncbi:MAG: hypothetical protein N2039_02370, partial [Gemmataceae bacterium]|nr:hypothetical protein [Gemmataceae bacterium]
MHRPMLGALWWALLLSVAGLGCWSQRKPPFAHSPVLLHYKPTLSDSATILAEMQARRGPQKPPMPSNGVEESAIEPANSLAPSIGEKPLTPTSDALPPLTEPFSQDRQPRPIIRASGQSSHTTELDQGANRSDTVHLPDLLPPPPGSRSLEKTVGTSTESVLLPPESVIEHSGVLTSTESVLTPPPSESARDSVPVVELPHGLIINVEGEAKAGTEANLVLDGPIAPMSPQDQPFDPQSSSEERNNSTSRNGVPQVTAAGTTLPMVGVTSLPSMSTAAAKSPMASVTGPPRKSVAGNFGHDPDRRWLQGVLERHYRGYYCLRYCDPSVEDEFGGKVRLQEDERLGQFRDGDVIGIIGRITEAAEVA